MCHLTVWFILHKRFPAHVTYLPVAEAHGPPTVTQAVLPPLLSCMQLKALHIQRTFSARSSSASLASLQFYWPTISFMQERFMNIYKREFTFLDSIFQLVFSEIWRLFTLSARFIFHERAVCQYIPQLVLESWQLILICRDSTIAHGMHLMCLLKSCSFVSLPLITMWLRSMWFSGFQNTTRKLCAQLHSLRAWREEFVSNITPHR